MATLGTLTLKLRATRKQLALDLLQSQQEIEQWQQSTTKSLSLKAGLAIDWDSFSKAESEIRRWVDNLPSANVKVKAKFVSTDLKDNLKHLESLLANPLKIQVDDKRLFELNEHFKLKERDYKQLQSVLTSPLSIKVDRTQLDNLSRDLRSIENTPQVNLRANVDTESLKTFHEQLNRYTQGRTLELATSVSRTTLNALQNDLKSLASNLTTARVSVQIDSQLQALRSELGNLPNTRVQIGVDVDDRKLRTLETSLERISKPHQLRLNLPSTIGGITSEIGKLFLSPITLPIKLAQNAVSGIFTGAFEGIGKEISREFGQGISAELKNVLTQRVAAPETLGRSLIQNLDRQYGASISSRKVPRVVRDLFAVDPEQVEADRIINKEKSTQREQKRQKKANDIAQKNYGTVEREARGLEYLFREQTEEQYEAFQELRPALKPIQSLQRKRQKLVKKAQKNQQNIGSTEIESDLISNLLAIQEKNPVFTRPELKEQVRRLQQLDRGIQRSKERVLAGHDAKLENRQLQEYILQKVATAKGNPQQIQQLESKLTAAKQQSNNIDSNIKAYQASLTKLEVKRKDVANSSKLYVLADIENREQSNLVSPERIEKNKADRLQLPRRKTALFRQQKEINEIQKNIDTEIAVGGVESKLKNFNESVKKTDRTRNDLRTKLQEEASLKNRIASSYIYTSDADHLLDKLVQNVTDLSGVKNPKSLSFGTGIKNKGSAAQYDSSLNKVSLAAKTLSKVRKGELLDIDEIEYITHEVRHAVQSDFGKINTDKDNPAVKLLRPSRDEVAKVQKRIETSTKSLPTQRRRNTETDAYLFATRNREDIHKDYLTEYLETQYGVGGDNYDSGVSKIIPFLSQLKGTASKSRSTKKEYASRVADVKALVGKINHFKESLANTSALNAAELYDLAKNKNDEINELKIQLIDNISALKSNIVKAPQLRKINLRAKNQPSDDPWSDNYESTPKTRNRKQRSGKPGTDADFWATQVDTSSRNFDQQYDRMTRQTERRLHRSINETTSESRNYQQKLADFDPLGKSTSAPPDPIASAPPDPIASAHSADPDKTTPPSFDGFLSKLDRVVTKFEHSVTKFEHSIAKIGNASESASPPNTQEVSHDNKIGNLGSMARSGYQGLQGMESAVLPFVPFGEQLKSIGKNIALPAALYAGVGMLPGGAAIQAGLGGAAHNLLALPAAGAVNAVSGAVGGAFGQIPFVGAPITHAATTLAGSMLEGLIALATPIIAGKGLIGVASQGAKLALPPAPEYDYVSAGAKVAQKAIAASQSLVTTETVPHHALPAAREKLNLAPAKQSSGLDLRVGTPPPENSDFSWTANARSIIKKHITDIDKAIVNGGIAAAKHSLDKLNTELEQFQGYVNSIAKTGTTEVKNLLSSDRGNLGKWKKIVENQAQAVNYIEMDADASGTYNPQQKSAFRKVTERYKRSLKNINRNNEGGYFDPTPAANSPVAKAIDFLNQPIEALSFLDTPLPNIFDRFKRAIGLNRKAQPQSVKADAQPPSIVVDAQPISATPYPLPVDKEWLSSLRAAQEQERETDRRAKYRSRPPLADPWISNSTPNRWTKELNLANYNAAIRSFTPATTTRSQLALPPAYVPLPDPFDSETDRSLPAPTNNLASIQARRARIADDQIKARLNRLALPPAYVPPSDPFDSETSQTSVVPSSNLASISARRARIADDQIKARLNRPALPPARPLGRAIPARGGALVLAESSALTPFVAALPEQLAWTDVLLQLPGQPSLPQGKPEYLHGTTIPLKPLSRPIPPPFPRRQLLPPTTVVSDIPRAKVIQQIPEIPDPWIEAELKGLKIEQELDFDRAMGTPTQSISLLSRLRGMLSQTGSDAKYYANGAYQQAKTAIPNTISAIRNQIGTSITNSKKRFTYSPNKHNQNYLEHSRQEGEDIIEPARAALNYEMERPDLIDPAKLKVINKATAAIDTYSTLTQQDSLNNKEVAQLKQAKKDVKGYLKDLDFQFAEDFNAGSKLNYILKESGLGMFNLGNITKTLIGGFAAFTGITFVGGIIAKIGAQAITAAANFQDLKLAVGAATNSQVSANALISRSTTQANQLGYNYQSAIVSDASFAAATKGTALELVSGNISTSLRQYNRVLGVSEERQKLSQIAVQQMAGKGTLAAEEVFGQLAESSPGAVNVLARSQGLTIGQLRARMQEGGLNSADTLSRFGMQLDAESTNSVDSASRSTSATIGKVQNSILSLQTSVGGQLLAPATAGLNAFNDVVKLTESNVDSIAKLSIANFTVLGAGALALAAKLLSFKAGFDTVGAGFAALGPHMLKFGLQTAAVYVALETVSGMWGSSQNTSPMKSIADDMDALLDKIKKNAGEAGKSLAELRDEKFSKNLSAFEQVGDFFNGGQRRLGANVTLNSERRADEDAITTDKVLDTTRAVIDRKPDLQIAASSAERQALALELTILRARRANLTSRDRDELQSTANREQVIIKRQAELDKPITTRQAELEAAIKANRAITEDPAKNPSEQASARLAIADAEANQRTLQAELSRSTDKISDLVVGLRKLTFESSAALKSIDQNVQLKSTQNYQAATLDPRNIGALQGTQAQDEIKKIAARRDVKQNELTSLRGKLTENSGILNQLEIDPDTTSKEKLEFLKNSKPDSLSQEIITYAQQYQQAKQDLLDSNDNLAKSQYNYIKSIADYNKGLTDQIISLQTRITNLQLTARGSIASLQNQIDQTLIEIDTTSTKALFQSQRNSIQSAYNKFLEKLGVSTDDVFEQIFQNFNAINDSIEQIAQRKIGRKQAQNTQSQRQNANELKKDQITTEQQQGLDELRRQENERQLSNPLNQLPPNPNQPTNLIPPVTAPITSPYGNRTHPVHGGTRHHDGIDYGTPVGTPIKAAGEGVVTFAGTKGGYGYTAEIRHPDGKSTLYAHQSKIGVSVGQKVEQGQIIGLSGGAKGHPGSGTSTGPHLHLGTRNAQGESIDPRTVLQGESLAKPLGTRIAPQPTTTTPVTTKTIKPKPIPTGQIFNTAPFTSAPASTEVYGPIHDPHRHSAKSPFGQLIENLAAPLIPKIQRSEKSATPIPSLSPLPKPQTKKATPLPLLPTPYTPIPTSQSPYTNVTSSFYTPGEGGAINGGKTDIRGKDIDRHSMVMATRTTASPQGIPYGATVELRNPQNGNTTIVKNVDRGTLRPGRDIDLTPAPAAKLGITPDGVAKLQMRVIAVPQGQPKPEYDLGGGIGSYDKKGNYTGKSGTIVRTQPSPNSPLPSPIGQAILNNALQQGNTQSIDKTTAISNKYVTDTNKLLDRDTAQSKQKLREDRNLSNQQDSGEYSRIDTQIIKNSNLIDRELPKFKRENTQLERKATALTRSENRSTYQQIDRISQQYGGIPDTSILDTSITEAQTTVDRIKEEARANRASFNDRIRIIQARGITATEASKTQPPIIAKYRKQGNNKAADRQQTILDNTIRAAGTPEFQQQTITSLTTARDALPSPATAVYNQIAPGASKAVTNAQALFDQYLPKNFSDKFNTEARAIAERFKAVQELTQSQLELLNQSIILLEAEIQTKLKTAGYTPQKLDLNDPKRVELLNKIAPEQTKKLQQATQNRDTLNQSSTALNTNAETATARSVRIAKQREQLNVDRVNTDYLATTQEGSVFAIAQVNNQRYTQGKTELDLQKETGAISRELYTANLKRLTLETNTFRNALLSLKPAAKGFFDEIFSGDRVFESFGSALRNLTINILKQFQDIISKQLGEQLFNSLMPNQQEREKTAGNNKDILTDTITKITSGVSLGISPTTPQPVPEPQIQNIQTTRATIFDNLRQSIPPQSLANLVLPSHADSIPGEIYGPQQQNPRPRTTSLGDAFGAALPGIALKLLGIPGFATGGLVTSPTLALVGEGINNEAIVPLPNGRSIPVDLKGAGESSVASAINNAISVTIQNSGEAKETSRGDANAIANIIQNLVTQELINQRRPGGLLA